MCLTPFVGAGAGFARHTFTGVTDVGFISDGTTGFGYSQSDFSRVEVRLGGPCRRRLQRQQQLQDGAGVPLHQLRQRQHRRHRLRHRRVARPAAGRAPSTPSTNSTRMTSSSACAGCSRPSSGAGLPAAADAQGLIASTNGRTEDGAGMMPAPSSFLRARIRAAQNSARLTVH